MDKIINVVKVGGNVIDDSQALKAFLKEFSSLEGMKILIHGGGKEATRLSGALGLETKMIGGRRVTDRDTLDIVTMVYAGLINKRIVSMLQSLGCDAVGLSGADGNLIPAGRRPASPVDYGFVGDIDPSGVSVKFLSMLLENGFVPVICAICHDTFGTLLNCNADSVAGAVAIGASRIAPVCLTYCFEKNGVLSDPDDADSVIERIDGATFRILKEDGVISGGMLPKVKNALDCASCGVKEVRICSADALLSVSGTYITE